MNKKIKNSVLAVLYLILITLIYFMHIKAYDFNSLTNIDHANPDTFSDIGLLKRNSFFGDPVYVMDVEDDEKSQQIVDFLSNYRYRKSFREGPYEEVQYFIGITNAQGQHINVVIQGDKHIHLETKYGPFVDMVVSGGRFNLDELENILN